MCRMLIYKGPPVIISKVTHEPTHSLMKQSKDGGFPGCDTFRNVRVNGDGFGIGWYNQNRIEAGACVYKCITPAWNNHNLKNIVKHIDSYLIMGHIRAVHRAYSPDHGHKNEISEDNCHPFVFGRYSFMHNGGISKFVNVKRVIREGLPDHLYNEITGTTDSEHLFAVLLDEIGDLEKELTAKELGDVVERTINRITKLSKSKGVTVGSSMNIILTDGRHLIATRCRTDLDDENPSLFYCVGSGAYDAKAASSDDNSICISSEPMSTDPRWTSLPRNHMITVPFVEGDITAVKEVLMRPLVVEHIHDVVPTSIDQEQPVVLGQASQQEQPIQVAVVVPTLESVVKSLPASNGEIVKSYEAIPVDSVVLTPCNGGDSQHTTLAVNNTQAVVVLPNTDISGLAQGSIVTHSQIVPISSSSHSSPQLSSMLLPPMAIVTDTDSFESAAVCVTSA